MSRFLAVLVVSLGISQIFAGEIARADDEVTLKYDDGSMETKQSTTGGGHAVLFQKPEGEWYLDSLEVFGARYGHEQPPDEDFMVYVTDAKMERYCAIPKPYGTFERGGEKWTTVPLPAVRLPESFYVCLFCIDGSIVRAHKAAAGAVTERGPAGEPEDHALGRSRGGFGTKLHLVCDARGLPIAIDVSPGQDHETTRIERVMESICVPSPRGAARRRPRRLAGDKAYSAAWVRNWLKQRRIAPVIAHRENEAGRNSPFDRDSYRRRNIIERCIGWIKELRRIATRYEKLAVHYLGMFKLGMILQYLKPAGQI